MELGAFSVSLAVRDIAASRAFYEKLGFTVSGGEQEQKWLILRNGNTVLGLFEGMFEKNVLTFNPGWDQQSESVDSFTDVRKLQERLKESGINLTSEVEPSGEGPGSIMLTDPDGNPILIDQHR